MVLSLDEKS